MSLFHKNCGLVWKIKKEEEYISSIFAFTVIYPHGINQPGGPMKVTPEDS